ncbi:MAG TPA: ATP-binding cassette domain-containing protein [Pirellulales bacterium]|nr:ATP-binding cassette domain-containing protein [Pirellulales bacterium]
MSWLEFDCRHRYPGGFELGIAFRADHPVVGLFGGSGSGKTTVLSVVAGALRPDQGCVTLDRRKLLDTRRGIDVAPQSRRVGMVFQDHLLFPHLSVERNLRYGLSRRGTAERDVDFARVVEVLELGDLLARLPRNLSGGERQRVALGRTLLAGPDALLLDEPLTALDQPLKERILVYLERVLAEWRLPTLFVSHVAADVRRLAEWVIVLEAGRLVGSGPPREVLPADAEQPQSCHGNPL